MKKMNKSFFFLVFVSFTILTMVACGLEGDRETSPKKNEGKVVLKDNFPITFKDGLDTEITLYKEPQRIVSLIPSNTEILFSLEVGERVVGVSDFDNYPEEVTSKERIGGLQFNVEKIISLNTDLVLAHESSAMSAEGGLNQLRNAGITVVVIPDASSFEGVYKTIKLIGNATGSTDKADYLVNEMQAKLENLKNKASMIKEKATVWIEVSPAPEIYTTGKNTLIHEMLESIVATNAASEFDGWVPFTEEDAVALKPDVIITTYGDFVENPKDQVLSRAAWAEVPAIINERVYDVSADKVTRPGPRLIEGVEELAKAVYPEIFAK